MNFYLLKMRAYSHTSQQKPGWTYSCMEFLGDELWSFLLSHGGQVLHLTFRNLQIPCSYLTHLIQVSTPTCTDQTEKDRERQQGSQSTDFFSEKKNKGPRKPENPPKFLGKNMKEHSSADPRSHVVSISDGGGSFVLF